MTRYLRIPMLCAACWLAAPALPSGQLGVQVRQIAAATPDGLRQWDAWVDVRQRDGELQVRRRRTDSLRGDRVHERLQQVHRGVPVYGADITRQLEDGVTVSLYGSLYEGIELAVEPRLSVEEATEAIRALTGVTLGGSRLPRLVVLPLEDRYALAYEARVFTGTSTQYFLDAHTGAVLLSRAALQSQAVGRGRGLLSDDKKMSVEQTAGAYLASDLLRPPAIITYDMRGDLNRVIAFLNGQVNVGTADVASDTDNVWDDGPTVDAHVYAGWTYDYLFKRFGRRGLDDNDITIRSFVHPVRRDSLLQHSNEIVGNFFLNAFYAGEGIMVYGVGLPAGFTDSRGRRWNYLSGALDVVAHELSHGVTDFSSQLVYENESGALNEAFSDFIAVGAEFFFQPPGNRPLGADYVLGEDVISPSGLRSLANPLAYGDPDHYSLRYRGPEDNGGVHINSAIAYHAFYLAIEGGTNRTSGLAVQGVGPTNRAQIEQVFFRAFTELLPANATFSLARAATIQSARDLYGAGSSAERAVTQAWNAVGVF